MYFYPREANGKFKNLQTVFNGKIGHGRVDIHRNSPTEQETTTGKYMTSEFLEFHAPGLFRMRLQGFGIAAFGIFDLAAPLAILGTE